MPEVLVALRSEFDESPSRVKVVQGREIGIFRLADGQFRAWENTCPHARGPVCQGRLMQRVEERLGEDRKSLGMCFSREQTNVVCPWHGYEFDLRTGRHQGSDRLRLRPYDLRVDGERIFVVV